MKFLRSNSLQFGLLLVTALSALVYLDYLSRTSYSVSSLATKSLTTKTISLSAVETEREWKYKKLLNVIHPEVNKYDFPRTFDSYRSDLVAWHKNLETIRDEWCAARYAASSNNGVDALINDCKIDFELRAIMLLDDVYYRGIMTETQGSTGIVDYESKSVSKVE